MARNKSETLSEEKFESAVDGAAADSADAEEAYATLPRLPRYALAADANRPLLRYRLLAEIAAAAPALFDPAQAWASDDRVDGATLCALLDQMAVIADRADLRSYADVVRLLSLPQDDAHRADFRRLAQAFAMIEQNLSSGVSRATRAKAAKIAIGWATLAAGSYSEWKFHYAWEAAVRQGDGRTRAIASYAEATERARLDAELEKKEEQRKEDEKKSASGAGDEVDDRAVAEGCVRICAMSAAERKNTKLRDLIRGHEHVIGVDVPLALTPDLREVRRQLAFEFPYAEAVIDFVLADLVGRVWVWLQPLLLVGKPGGGKSRFARRLAELLGVGVWRTDAAQCDGAVFAGTAKRWNSAEPAHPFLAISRSKMANPFILVDEIEKAGTRSDYGRFWDVLLGMIEPETSRRYPDPGLQVDVDLSHVSFVATANSTTPLPPALHDRFRVVEFPEPRSDDLDKLLPSLLVDIALERGLDPRWTTPLLGWERDLVAARWRGGSVRRLRRFVEAVVRARERDAVRQ